MKPTIVLHEKAPGRFLVRLCGRRESFAVLRCSDYTLRCVAPATMPRVVLLNRRGKVIGMIEPRTIFATSWDGRCLRLPAVLVAHRFTAKGVEQ